MNESKVIFMRKVRSFVRRDGRMTDAQRSAFATLWPKFGLQQTDEIDFQKIFQRDAQRVLEIGFGSGYSLIEAAKQYPQYDFIGIEMHRPGIGTLLLGIESNQLTNVRVFYADAVEVLKQMIPDNSLNIVQIFFPDPWQKRKHHKRRLIQPEFVELVVRKLKLNGMLHLATDWEDYAQQMLEVLSAEPQLENMAGDRQFAGRSIQRPVITKFELRGQQSGRVIRELQFKKTAGQ